MPFGVVAAAVGSLGLDAATAAVLTDAITGAGVGGILGGGISGLEGGNVGQGILHGVEGGALTGGGIGLGGDIAGSLGATAGSLGATAGDVLGGAAGGALGSSITGGKPLTGALEGGISGGLSGLTAQSTGGTGSGGAAPSGSAGSAAAPPSAPLTFGGDATIDPNAAALSNFNNATNSLGTLDGQPGYVNPSVGGASAGQPSGVNSLISVNPASNPLTQSADSTGGGTATLDGQPGYLNPTNGTAAPGTPSSFNNFVNVQNPASSGVNLDNMGSNVPDQSILQRLGITSPNVPAADQTANAATFNSLNSGLPSSITSGGNAGTFGESSNPLGSASPSGGSSGGASSGGASGPSTGSTFLKGLTGPIGQTGTNFTNMLEANPGAVISAGGLGFSALESQKSLPGEGALRSETNQLGAQSSQLESYLQTGTLPPGVSAALNQAGESAKAAIRSRYAQMGSSGSSAEQQELAAVDQNTQAQGVSVAMDLLKQGVSEAGLSSNLYNEIIKNAMEGDNELGTAIGQFGAALSGQPQVKNIQIPVS